MSQIVCVTPTNRPDRWESFRSAWRPLFDRHRVTLVTVRDGDDPKVSVDRGGERAVEFPASQLVAEADRDLFCRRTDAVRNYGFVLAAKSGCEFVLTLDDDVLPPPDADPIADHLDVLRRRVPVSWMNTAMDPAPYLRGVPYAIRDEAPVMLSHGVWTNVPDFDAPTQLLATGKGLTDLPFYVGPVPRGVLFPMCGMNLMFRSDLLPIMYFAPMGPDCGRPELNRFGDIWCGIVLKRECDRRGWAIYSGASSVCHTRASDVFKNLAAEAEGLRLNEGYWQGLHDDHPYFAEYARKRERYAELVRGVQAAGVSKGVA